MAENVNNTSSNENSNKLKIKLIIAIVLFILAVAMLGIGIWASQAGKNLFKGFVSVTTKDISARVTAQVTGSRTTSGEGYDSEKILWDSEYASDDDYSANWSNIDFTFANKDSVIELVIKVENRKVTDSINTLLNAKLGDTILDTTEQEIGDTNIIAYIVAPDSVGCAIDETNTTVGIFKVVLKIANKNHSVKATDLEVSLMLTDPNYIEEA